jgi:hypothetical protein
MEDPLSLSADPILNDPETAKAMHISVATLRRLRKAGKGPPRTQLSDHRFGYLRSNIRRHLIRNTEVVV